MHELSITDNIFKQVLKHAKSYQAKSIKKIKLQIGAASGIIPDCVKFYFNILKEKTIAANCVLEFEIKPIILKCPKCKKETVIEMGKKEKFILPCSCDRGIEIIQGNDITIEYMEIE